MQMIHTKCQALLSKKKKVVIRDIKLWCAAVIFSTLKVKLLFLFDVQSEIYLKDGIDARIDR